MRFRVTLGQPINGLIAQCGAPVLHTEGCPSDGLRSPCVQGENEPFPPKGTKRTELLMFGRDQFYRNPAMRSCLFN